MIANDIGASFEAIRQSIHNGISFFTHWWDHSVEETTKGKYKYWCANTSSNQYWAKRSGNNFKYVRNVYSKVSGGRLNWNLSAIEFAAAHEPGHALFGKQTHFTNPPYYNDPSFGHVMAITSYWYQGSFSPLEVYYGITTLKWKLKSNAMHPFSKLWLVMSDGSKNMHRETMLKINTPYAELGLYRPIGDSEIDNLMAQVPRKPAPKITFGK